MKPHSIAEKQLQKDLIEAFEDSGVALPPDRRARFKEISDRLTELAQEFAKNIRENTTRLHFTPEECDGMPQSWLDRVPRDEQGNIVVGFDYPDYIPFMTNARNEAARKRYHIAYTNRGTPKNLEILDEIVALRKEIADLYGVPTYAHYVTKRRMVENPETVLSFLDEVRAVVTEAEIRDLGDLGVMKSEITGIPAEKADIERWDMSFYRERLREKRFAIDQEALRKYFPTAPAVEWMLDISRAPVRIEVRARDRAGVARRRDLPRRDRRRHGRAPGRHLPRSLSARRQVQARRGVAGARRLAEDGTGSPSARSSRTSIATG